MRKRRVSARLNRNGRKRLNNRKAVIRNDIRSKIESAFAFYHRKVSTTYKAGNVWFVRSLPDCSDKRLFINTYIGSFHWSTLNSLHISELQIVQERADEIYTDMRARYVRYRYLRRQCALLGLMIPCFVYVLYTVLWH